MIFRKINNFSEKINDCFRENDLSGNLNDFSGK